MQLYALCAFTLCNGYARILGLFGVEHEDTILMGDKETLENKVNEGIALLRRSSSHRGTLLSIASESGDTSPLRTGVPHSSRLMEIV